MRWKVVIGNLGSILKLFGFAFYLPVIPALYYLEAPLFYGIIPFNALVFLFMANFTIALGYPMEAFGRAEDFHRNEAVIIVSSTWIVLALLSSIPFLIIGVFTSPVDAFFEAMSGMTTTGATVMVYPLEQYPKSIHMWRGFLQWLGGMGVIVLSVAVLSKLSRGGLTLLEAEAPGPSITRLKPKIMETAKILWYIYGLLTLCMIILLLGAGTTFYDAVLHAFTTMSTGGFSSHTSSVGYFPSGVQWIIIFFMLMGGINFSLHYQLFKGNVKKALANTELQVFLGIVVSGTVIVTYLLLGTGLSNMEAFRTAMFQIVAFSSNTGYFVENYDAWPEFSRLILLMLMFVGASAGSTGGGMKVLRVTLLFKMVLRSFREFINPRRMLVVRMGGRVINENTLKMVSMFFLAYIFIFIIGTMLLVALGMDMISSVSASVSALSNVGPGLGLVGPVHNYRAVPLAGRFLLSVLMWIGRLEIFTAVVLFNPNLYKERRLSTVLRLRR